MKNGRALLPLVKLIEQSRLAMDELIDVSGRAHVEAVLQLSEPPLALTNTQADAVALLNPSAEGLPVPQGSGQTDLARRAAERRLNLLPLLFADAPRPSGAIPFHQPCQTTFLEPAHPIFHRARSVAQQSRYLWTGHSLGHEQHPMQSMVITRFFRATNLILKSQHNGFRIGNRKWFHAPMKPHFSMMRNYLGRYV